EVSLQLRHSSSIFDECPKVHEHGVLIGPSSGFRVSGLIPTSTNQLESGRQLTADGFPKRLRKGFVSNHLVEPPLQCLVLPVDADALRVFLKFVPCDLVLDGGVKGIV